MAKEREFFIHGKLDEEGNIEIPGCVRNGIDEASANKIFDEMAEFAKYAFNKSHAAAYAVVSYRTAYLKAYYPSELMAATLNSFLGNLDKVPEYIDECKRMKIEILKPDINKSFTKFTVDNEKIRFGLGSIKNVGVAAVEAIVAEREKNGAYESFANFCERIQNEAVNKKCIESLIKAGAFDEFEQTRSTLMASFETIVDTINDTAKKSFQGQVSMFDLGGSSSQEEELEKIKYNYTTLKEYSEKDLLSMEKEMLGLYITGHPLAKLKEAIEKQSTVNTMKIRHTTEGQELEGNSYKDGQQVKIAGIITSVKKKFTKNNKMMAFITVEDLYVQVEVIAFDNCYHESSSVLMEDTIVLVDGRLSVREDEETKIVAREITLFEPEGKKVEQPNVMLLDVTNLTEEQKAKLRGALRFFSGERNNTPVQVKNGEKISNAGSIFANAEVKKEIEEIMGNNCKV